MLVLNGNGADVATHCVPAVPTKRYTLNGQNSSHNNIFCSYVYYVNNLLILISHRISITFRRMDESKRPTGYVSEHDLQGLQPLSYEARTQKKSSFSRPRFSARKQSVRQEESMERVNMPMRRHSDPRYAGRYQRGPANRQWYGANT